MTEQQKQPSLVIWKEAANKHKSKVKTREFCEREIASRAKQSKKGRFIGETMFKLKAPITFSEIYYYLEVKSG